MASPIKKEKAGPFAFVFADVTSTSVGYPSSAAARRAAEAERVAVEQNGQPQGLGPHRTPLAVAFADYARERLPFLKGARQDANRINQYLRACGLPVIHLEKVDDADEQGACHWRVSLKLSPRALYE